MRVAGIDPGFQGALAVLEVTTKSHPQILFTCDMPVIEASKATEIDIKELSSLLFAYDVECVIIEKAQVMPKQGVVSSGNYMKNYGMILATLILTHKPFIEVSPNKWKRDLKLGAGKEASILLTRHLFPSLEIKRKKDHNICEAILVAYWGVKHYLKF